MGRGDTAAFRVTEMRKVGDDGDDADSAGGSGSGGMGIGDDSCGGTTPDCDGQTATSSGPPQANKTTTVDIQLTPVAITPSVPAPIGAARPPPLQHLRQLDAHGR